MLINLILYEESRSLVVVECESNAHLTRSTQHIQNGGDKEFQVTSPQHFPGEEQQLLVPKQQL